MTWFVLCGLVTAMAIALMSVRGHRERGPTDAGGKLPAREGRLNRLAKEKSPYLLQHADNPVHWYPWGEEAFEKARQEDKPIFLSIGYSTCHWCHVMEHESFEDPEVARLMNEIFVSIKVDREERPDIDSIYMKVCQIMTRSGGWPLTIIMTPDKKPFFAGTYFPKESRFGQMGMLDLLPAIRQAWETQRPNTLAAAEDMVTVLGRISRPPAGEEISEQQLTFAYEQLAADFDARNGGFGSAPKFPTPHNLLFLLRYWKRTGEEKALAMVEKTLQEMRRGGLYDQIGFGFHRYSTDARWLVPHFEKMLYDQALLALAYTEAFQATAKEEYAQTARQIFTYVLRDMTSPEGAFYSAEDADSEGEEGKFYLWTEDEIRHLLPPREADLIVHVFNVSQAGNFAEETTAKGSGRNIMHLEKSLADSASHLAMSEQELHDRLDAARENLFAARQKRVHPHKDDKILTDWNGLMIVALGKAAQAFDEPAYAHAANRAADFILKGLRTNQGRLLHRYRDGEAAVAGNADDYAFLIWGLIELYQATFHVQHLEMALDLNAQLLRHFWDEEGGGFFFTADDQGTLLVRQKEMHDGAVPSGNSVAMLNLLRLGRITASPELEQKAARIGRAFAGAVRQMPSAFTQLISAVDFAIGPSYEVVIVGKPNAEDTRAMLRALRQPFSPRKVVLFRPAEDQRPAIVRLAEFTRYQTSIDGKATAYVCRNHACNSPTTDPAKMLELLNQP